jgi:hypothetical protein
VATPIHRNQKRLQAVLSVLVTKEPPGQAPGPIWHGRRVATRLQAIHVRILFERTQHVCTFWGLPCPQRGLARQPLPRP